MKFCLTGLAAKWCLAAKRSLGSLSTLKMIILALMTSASISSTAQLGQMNTWYTIDPSNNHEGTITNMASRNTVATQKPSTVPQHQLVGSTIYGHNAYFTPDGNLVFYAVCNEDELNVYDANGGLQFAEQLEGADNELTILPLQGNIASGNNYCGKFHLVVSSGQKINIFEISLVAGQAGQPVQVIKNKSADMEGYYDASYQGMNFASTVVLGLTVSPPKVATNPFLGYYDVYFLNKSYYFDQSSKGWVARLNGYRINYSAAQLQPTLLGTTIIDASTSFQANADDAANPLADHKLRFSELELNNAESKVAFFMKKEHSNITSEHIFLVDVDAWPIVSYPEPITITDNHAGAPGVEFTFDDEKLILCFDRSRLSGQNIGLSYYNISEQTITDIGNSTQDFYSSFIERGRDGRYYLWNSKAPVTLWYLQESTICKDQYQLFASSVKPQGVLLAGSIGPADIPLKLQGHAFGQWFNKIPGYVLPDQIDNWNQRQEQPGGIQVPSPNIMNAQCTNFTITTANVNLEAISKIDILD